MGCGSGKDIKITADPQIRVIALQTGIIEFDQIFLLLAEIMNQAEKIRQNVVPSRYNMIHIVKAHHLNDPSVVEAYRLWTLGVSCCNNGQSRTNGVKLHFDNNKLDYNLGLCGDCRFNWFGDYLNAYFEGVAAAAIYFPIVKDKILELFERIKGMKDKIKGYVEHFPLLTDKLKAGVAVVANVVAFGVGVKICQEFQLKLDGYALEIKELLEQHVQIEEEADQNGAEIFKAYGTFELAKLDPHEKTLYRLKCKMNDIVNNYSKTERRTVIEQDEDTANKQARSKCMPRKTKDYKPDDLPCELKHFPWRLRWIGCNMSGALEDHQIQKTQLQLFKRLISYKLNLFVLQDESMINAFKVFLWAMTADKGTMVGKITIKDESPYCIGLDKMKSKNADLEEVRTYFMEYFKLCCPDRRGPLDDSWTVFNEKFELIEKWSKGEFQTYEPFKLATLADQYNMMTNIAKNIYALRAYKPVAQKVYEKSFGRFKTESEQMWQQSQNLIDNSGAESSLANGISLKDIASKITGTKQTEEKVVHRQDKLAKVYDEYLQSKIKK